MVSSVSTLLGIILLTFAVNQSRWVVGFEIYMQQLEVKSPTRVPGVYKIPVMRVINYDRTAHVVNMSIFNL